MERKEFLSLLSTSSASILLFTCLGGCGGDKSEDPQPNQPASNPNSGTGSNKKDFTLDLNTTINLKTKGNATVQNGVIVAFTNAGTYVAVAATCTHEGVTIGYDAGGSRFSCPGHGSNFNENGTVINGPATSSLKQYKTTLTGNNLRIYED